MIVIRCADCDLQYDQAAYTRHLKNPCEHGIYPMLACDVHQLACPYVNHVWRYEKGASWTDKDRPCKPIFSVRAGWLRFSPDQDKATAGTYLGLYEPEHKQRPNAPRLPGNARRADPHEGAAHAKAALQAAINRGGATDA